MVNQNEILEKYLTENLDLPFSTIADLILDDYPSIGLAHRTIRAKLSGLKEELENNPSIISSNSDTVISETVSNNTVLNYNGRKSITNEQEAIEFFKIDLEKNEIVKSEFSAWDTHLKNGDEVECVTNYRVKLFIKAREEQFNFEKAKEKLNIVVKSITPKKVEGKRKGVVAITDIHAGAKVKNGVINSREFNADILAQYLNNTVAEINALEREEIVVAILGDLIESFTGLNHLNSWQELDKWQGHALIFAYELLQDFISKINNVSKIVIVSGNHDRTTSEKQLDREGTVAQLIAYMLSKNYDVAYHSLVVPLIYDEISYLFTHGHHSIIKNLPRMILNYGNQNYYNVVVSGHLHSRFKKTPTLNEGVFEDSVNYRGIVVAPLFTGNIFSESLGYTSTAGFSYIERSQYGKNINHFDFGF